MKSVFILALLLSGCGVITKDDWEAAEIACQPFGGVKKVHIRGVKAECENGQTVSDFNHKNIIGDFES